MPDLTQPRRPTKGERIAREKLFAQLWIAECDSPDWDRVRRHIPDAWHLITADLDVTEKKEKVTLYLDTSVARVFRTMGIGYRARINRILATWVHLQAAGMIREREAFEERMRGVLGG